MKDSLHQNYTNIIFTRADKGNSTVALDKDQYTNKIVKMLQAEIPILLLKRILQEKLSLAYEISS